MSSNTSPVITRFAPSPTGHLHIGGARTALFAWAYARRHGGVFVLRIEDTDQARSSEESTRGILQDLAWLDILWDEGPEFASEGGKASGGDPRGVGPFSQSQRLDLYNAHMERLIDAGRAYHAFESPEELDEKRKASLAAGRQHRYDRAALEVPEQERKRRAAAGEPHVVRFRVPDGAITLTDEVLGEVTLAPGEVDDFIIRKRDGFPTYHFAVVVDDELMGVTHVIRGQEHLNNTPRHVALQEALGFRVPKFAHLPLIFSADGSKMSKRDKDKAARDACKRAGVEGPPATNISADEFAAWMKDNKRQLQTEQLAAMAESMGLELPEIDVEDFRAAGYLPDVVCNYISLLGWSPPAEAGKDIEKFDMAFLCKWFELGRIGKTNARFDRNKLLAFNNDAIGAMSDEEFADRWREWCARYEPQLPERLGADRFAMLAAALRPRTKTLREAAAGAGFALLPDDAIEFDAKAVEKTLKKNDGEGLAVLRELKPLLEALPTFDPAPIHTVLETYAAEKGLGMGKIAQPLRVALTGGTVSPPIDATVAVLGREAVVGRIERCVREIGG
ncbi:MAG: glutamate--tRNA ligase [Phycisphaeraceae bacterium]|nr:MAG: glutamate--tRNA ligase [Phycisphaeraceae bacterium]